MASEKSRSSEMTTEKIKKCPADGCKNKALERWQGRTAVVTGASSGIGAAMAVTLADAGLRVIGLARRKNLVDDLKLRVTGKGSITGHECDLSNPEDIAASFRWIDERCGGTDLLVNNAGIIVKGQITDFGANPVTDEDIISIIDVNTKAAMLCTRYAVNSMKNRDYTGQIVIINSISGHYTPMSNFYNIYSASKQAITAFCTCLINELAKANSNIKVTDLSPGLVTTNMTTFVDQAMSIPTLKPTDISSALLYVIGTPPNVNVTNIIVEPVRSLRM